MSLEEKWELTKKQQSEFINALTPELTALRAKANISQADIANLLGISRQTYSSIERGTSQMSWPVFLSIILFYDYNASTHQMIRDIGAFPEKLIETFNGKDFLGGSDGIAGIPKSVTDELDDAAYQAIRTVIMLEYARCKNLPGEAIIKSFNGISFIKPENNIQTAHALKRIRESRQKDDV